ncbi:flavin reductase [Roseibium sp.]|uniref:flavin reductase n=1 Tax=Roseibium sp. TaxID=1936156 RepID=UPI003A98763C
MTEDPTRPTDIEPTELRPLDSNIFREAMSRIASAVHLVTTDGASGRVGATISAMCSVSDDPASILICVNRESRFHEALLENRCYCVNTLEPTHEAVSDIFAGRGEPDMDKRFDNLDWITLATGSPALANAKLSVDCTLETVTEAGTHSIFVGRVADIRLNEDGHSLLYVRRGYQTLLK